MNKFGLILLFTKVAKRYEKANKENSSEPFVYGISTLFTRA